mgnify:CR=1 FL=1
MAYTTIDNPALFFNTVLYTGDLQDSDGTGHTQSITGVGFQPDWVWHKGRSGARTHMLVDRVRGVSSYNWLASSGDGAELTTNTNGAISSIDSDGITVQNGNDSSSKSNNAGKNGETWVFWNWLAGGSTSSNGNGSITSTVSVNSTSGFSIVSYVGGGASSATVGHGLGATPAMIIVKNRSITEEWRVWHQKLSGSTYKVSLNSSGAQDSSATVFNGQSSTTFTVGNDPSVSGSGNNIIAYCFKEVKGYSKFGGYTGNGSTSGPFVYTGFKPAWVMMKRTNGSNSWNIFDNKRATDNPVQHRLFPDTTDAEATSSGNAVDFLSNGFVGRSSGSTVNHDGGTYIYMAFAETPFVTEGTKAAGTAR